MSNGEYYDEELKDESMAGFHEVEDDLFEDEDSSDFLKKSSLTEDDELDDISEDNEFDLSDDEDMDFESSEY